MGSLILADTIWNTNFVLSSSMTVMPGVTLSIVNAKIEFENSASINLQTNSTVILQDSEFAGPSGEGLQFLNEDTAFVVADNFTCSNMDTCITRRCCHGNEVEISNSIFKDNRSVFRGYSGIKLLATNCVFSGNGHVAESADYEFRCCTFSNNTVAVGSSRTRVYDSIFKFNGKAMQSGYMDNVVFYRNEVALSPPCCGNAMNRFERVSFVENEIAIQAQGSAVGSGYDPTKESNFVDNKMNIVYTGSTSGSVTSLYWGTTNISDIRSKIVDIYTDPTYGLLTIKPISDTPFLHELYDGMRPWVPPESLIASCPVGAGSSNPSGAPSTDSSGNPSGVPSLHPSGSPIRLPTNSNPSGAPTCNHESSESPSGVPKPTPAPTAAPSEIDETPCLFSRTVQSLSAFWPF